MKKIVATIEARMNSSRLPGKVLKEINGKPMIEYLINRLKTIDSIDEIILATTDSKSDDKLEKIALENSILVYRGSEENVMSRVLFAAENFNADIIVETHGDNPLLDPQIIDQAISMYLANNLDYIGNSHIHSYPLGMDIQVFSTKALRKSYDLTSDKLDREHVTLHIRKNPKLFRSFNLIAPQELRRPEIHLTVDEEEDFELVSKIIQNFGKKNPNFSCLDIIDYLDTNNNLLKINKSIQRKGDN